MEPAKKKVCKDHFVYIHVDNAKVYMPMNVAKQSDMLDHINAGEMFPVNGVPGVSKQSVRDLVFIHSLFANNSMTPNDILTNEFKESMKLARELVKRWRTRLGMLLSTSAFLCFENAQKLVDDIMIKRCCNVYNKKLKIMIMENVFDQDNFIDFFIGKLKYERLHFEVVAAWTRPMVCEMFQKMGVVDKSRVYDGLVNNFKFKAPCGTHGLILNLFRNDGYRVFNEEKITCAIGMIKKYLEDPDSVLVNKDTKICFVHYHQVFRMMRFMNEDDFASLLVRMREDGVQVCKIRFEAIESWQGTAWKTRPIIYQPNAFIMDRWLRFFNAIGGNEVDLDFILRCGGYFVRRAAFEEPN